MFAGKTVNPAVPGFWSRAGNQARAAAEGFADGLTFGLDDQAAAGVHAVADWFGGKPIRAAYKQRIAEQHASDAYDAAHYGAARTAGTIATVLIPGGELGALARFAGKVPTVARLGGRVLQTAGKWGAAEAKLVRRIPEVTRLAGRERAAIGVAGAGGGVLGQGVSDVMQGRLSSPRDYGGAAIGGMAEALAATRGRPSQAAALGGATTSLAQDALNRRPFSVANAAKAASASSLLSSTAGKIAARKAAQATIVQKAKLGETGSKIRTLMNLDWTHSTKKERYWLDAIPGYNRGYTYPDQRTVLGKLIESKFGETAELSDRQMQAYLQLGSHYRVDHFLPRDVASLAGFLFSQPAHNAGHQGFQGLDPSRLPRLSQTQARSGPGFSHFG